MLILLNVAVVLLALPARAQGLALAPGDPVPELQGAMNDAPLHTVAWSGAKLTLVHFWSTGCVPCRIDIPAIQTLWRERRKDGFRVVGVVFEQSRQDPVAAFLKELGADYPVLYPTTATLRAWKEVTLLPTTFLVGKDGRVLRRYVGADPVTVEGMRADVVAVLEGKPMPPQVMPGPESGQDAKP
ncbi:MAG TPA: TlpA disulfide reductase family protein [Candidatus Polarisedimenticolaceae bacterium]